MHHHSLQYNRERFRRPHVFSFTPWDWKLVLRRLFITNLVHMCRSDCNLPLKSSSSLLTLIHVYLNTPDLKLLRPWVINHSLLLPQLRIISRSLKSQYVVGEFEKSLVFEKKLELIGCLLEEEMKDEQLEFTTNFMGPWELEQRQQFELEWWELVGSWRKT